MAVLKGIPTLGICYGQQLMAQNRRKIQCRDEPEYEKAYSRDRELELELGALNPIRSQGSRHNLNARNPASVSILNFKASASDQLYRSSQD